MLDQNSIFYGVRISKPDGDEAYRWYMTRPDPPYLPPPAGRKQIAASPMHQPIDDPQEEGLVVHEVKEAPSQGAVTVNGVERVVHVQGPTAQAFAYVAGIVDENGKPIELVWAALLQATANVLIDEYGVRETHVDVPTDDDVDQWVAELFVTIAIQELNAEGIENPTPEQVSERTHEILADHVALERKFFEDLEAAEEEAGEPDLTASKEAVIVNLTDEQVEAYGWADELEPAKAKRGLTYWWIYFTIWLKTVFFGGRR